MDAEILKLTLGVIIGGFIAIAMSSAFPTQVANNISALGMLMSLLGILLLAIHIVEQQ